MFYYYDVELVHAFIFIIPCLLITLFKVSINKCYTILVVKYEKKHEKEQEKNHS